MKLSEFSAAVLRVSEKAAQIARLIRSEEALFSLLVEEKTGASKNQRFLQDFKTLADVLIQETVRHDLGEQVSGRKTRCHEDDFLSEEFLHYCLVRTLVRWLAAPRVSNARLWWFSCNFIKHLAFRPMQHRETFWIQVVFRDWQNKHDFTYNVAGKWWKLCVFSQISQVWLNRSNCLKSHENLWEIASLITFWMYAINQSAYYVAQDFGNVLELTLWH